MGIPDRSDYVASESVEDVAFLANSENRLAVLTSLAEGEHARHVLAEQTDVSRVTIARILDDFEDRQWVTQRGQIATITPLGAWVAEEFGELCTMMTRERKLRSVVQWLPDEGYEFHIRHLEDADITLVSSADATAPIDRLVRQLHATEHVDCFSFGITGQFLKASWQYVIEREHTYEWVFTTEVLDVLQSNDVMRNQSLEMLESERARFYRYDGDIPYVVILTNAMVNLRLADNAGAPSALIQSDNEAVRTWAESTFEAYKRDGMLVEPESFA